MHTHINVKITCVCVCVCVQLCMCVPVNVRLLVRVPVYVRGCAHIYSIYAHRNTMKPKKRYMKFEYLVTSTLLFVCSTWQCVTQPHVSFPSRGPTQYQVSTTCLPSSSAPSRNTRNTQRKTTRRKFVLRQKYGQNPL